MASSNWPYHITFEMKKLERELKASRAEVARLQKELDATCNAEELRQERETRKRAEAEVARLKEELQLARLAPAPEESVTQKGSPNKETPLGTTLRSEEYVLAGDKNLEGEFNIVKEPVPEWRELGPDEVIQEGDEARFQCIGAWISTSCIGLTPNRAGEALAFRTRRPLPKQEEMFLDSFSESLKLIEGDTTHLVFGKLDNEEIFGEIGNCLRLLRDEIEALKKNQK